MPFASFLTTLSSTLGGISYPAAIEKAGLQHLFGTDPPGRDLFSRILYGTRITPSISLFTLALAVPVGTLTGLASSYFGGWLDTVLMRWKARPTWTTLPGYSTFPAWQSLLPAWAGNPPGEALREALNL